MKAGKKTIIVSAAILVMLATLPLYSSGYIISLLVGILMYAILAMSWNFLSGYTGYITLGTAAFFGLGAYTAVIGWNANLPYPLIVFLGGIVSMVFAFIIGFPCLRIRGPYFVILTYGLAEAIRFIIEQISTASGLFGHIIVGAPSMEVFYYSMLIICLLAIIVDVRIRNSKFGFGLSGIKGDEAAAEAIGVDTTKYKLAAFGISALFAGMVGTVMALRWTYIVPAVAFNPMVSFQTMIIAILGGTRDFRGPILGAVCLMLISEAFGVKFPYYYMILLGLTLILIVKFLPMGLTGAIDRWILKRQ